MSSQQQPPSRPWFRLATMVRPPPPPPPLTSPTPQSNQPPPPPRSTAFIRPAFTQTAPQPTQTPIPPPQPPTQTPPPPPPQQPNPTPSHPQPQRPPSPVQATNGVAPPTPSILLPPATSPTKAPHADSPISPSRKPSQPSTPTTPPPTSQQSAPPPPPQSRPILPSPATTRSPITATRSATPVPSSPPKIVKPVEYNSPSSSTSKVVTPLVSPRVQDFSLKPPPPKKTHFVPSPPSSPPHLSPLQQSKHPLRVSNSPPPSPRSRSATPSSPPKIIKTSPPSTTIKPLSRAVSPLSLPSLKHKSYNESPPEIEFKQKTMHVQEAKEKHKGRHIGGGTHDMTKKPEIPKKHWDSENQGKSIITITGENRGAIMKLTPSSDKKHEFGNSSNNINIRRDNPTSPSDGKMGSEGMAKAKNKNKKSNPLLTTAFLNSNVQGVNNSILYSCSTNHHDPGIHLSLSRKHDGDHGFHLKEHMKE